ncbi:MAG: LamB/YcsF family protein [Verrucomicrobiota bacterium]
MDSRSDIILNCDLGEHEKPARTEELMRCIGAANIACGGHAGDADSMRHCLRLCRKYGVLAGAHPGMAAEGGRGDVLLTSKKLLSLLQEQVECLAGLAEEESVSLHHIKLHGSLYHAVEKDEKLAHTYIKFLKSRQLPLTVFSLAQGAFCNLARSNGLKVWEEAFADRAYEDDGSLRSRKFQDAVISDKEQVVARVAQWLKTGCMQSNTGHAIQLKARTLCIHSDSPDALALLKALARLS